MSLELSLLQHFVRGIILGIIYTNLLRINKWSRLVFYLLTFMSFSLALLEPSKIGSTYNTVSDLMVSIIGLLIGNMLGRGIADKIKEDWL